MAKDGNNAVSHKGHLHLERVQRVIKNKLSTVHFIGIGGVSMSSLARLTMKLGCTVTGSDRCAFSMLGELTSLGARIVIGHAPELVESATLVVYSHAIADDDPELVRARELEITTISRADYLGAIMLDYTNRIGVSGTHGKSTTTAMLDKIFTVANASPTVISGASLSEGSPLRIGDMSTLIYEACEYKDSFLSFSPTVAIATNLELDHTDYFKDISELRESFRCALSHASDYVVVNYDDVNLAKILPSIKARTVTFGTRKGADYRYSITAFLERGYEFDISRYGTAIASFKLNIPGTYNVANAVSAIVCALEFGIDIDTVKEAISRFSGIERRLEYVGKHRMRPVYYDYAHHPTAIASVINTVRMITRGEVTVVFKPHTYSRTASLWEKFKSALSLADKIILTDIYPAREEPMPNISSERMARELGDRAVYLSDAEVVYGLDTYSRGAVIIMGAGDMSEIKDAILKNPI